MRLNLPLGIIVVLVLLLQGCGKKGPLTLPQSYAPDVSSSRAEG
ncbi:MAG: lipoprotein [Gallionella sp.]|nr:lipoprotein [Gallionella sp.]